MKRSGSEAGRIAFPGGMHCLFREEAGIGVPDEKVHRAEVNSNLKIMTG